MKRIQSNLSKDFQLKSALRAYSEGGFVRGPGGPKSDKVNAKVSNGEYVLPAETVEALGGPEAIDRMVLRTTGKQPGPKMVDGTAHAADGGFFDSAREKLAQAANKVGQMVSPKATEQAARAAGEAVRGAADAAATMKDAAKAGYEAGPAPASDPNVYNPKADKAYQSARQSTSTLVGRAGGVVNNTGPQLGTPPATNPGLRGRVGGMLAATAMEAPQAYQDMTTPGMTGADQVARGAESASRLASGWLGMKAGGTAGAAMGGPFAWATAPAGALAGGALGYFAPDLVSKGYKAFSGDQSPILPSERAAELRGAGSAPPGAPPPNFGNAQTGMSSTAPIAGMPNFGSVQSGKSSIDRPVGVEERTPQEIGRDRMAAYARESALRKQMVLDQRESEYNPGTGLAEYMPETDRFGMTAGQRTADMARFNAETALARAGSGGRYGRQQLGVAEGYLKSGDAALEAENKATAFRKEGVQSALTRDAAIRAKREDNRTELDKTGMVADASRYRDDQHLAGTKYAADATVGAAGLRAQGDILRAKAEAGDKAAKRQMEARDTGTKALTEDLARRYGDTKADPAALQKANDVQRLLLGTMGAAGYGPELLADPRIKEALIAETEQSIKVRDSGKGIMQALQRLIDPNRREMLSSDVGSDYKPQGLRKAGILDRTVDTKAGSSDEAVHEFGDENAGILDRLRFDRQRRKKYLDSLPDLLRNPNE